MSDVTPTGISPVLRSAFGFLRNMSDRFARELPRDQAKRAKQFVKTVCKKYV